MPLPVPLLRREPVAERKGPAIKNMKGVLLSPCERVWFLGPLQVTWSQMCCLLLGDSPVICKMLPSCRSPALCPPSPPVLPISMSQSGPTRPPPGLLDPPGFCKLGIFGQTLGIPGSQTCVFWQRGWVLSSACLAFHRYLAANWRLAAKERVPGQPWVVCVRVCKCETGS